MINIKLVLFDIGGVLIDYGDVFKAAALEQNIPHELIDKTFDKYETEITTGKITPQQLYLNCLDNNTLKANKNYNFMDAWLRDYGRIQPTFDLIPLLKKHYKVGLFSNIYKEMVPEMIKRSLIPNINYDYIFLSCEIGLQKPNTEIYKHILTTTKLQPHELFFIDDRDDYLIPAKKLGWYTYKFVREKPVESVEKLKELLLC